MGTIEYLHRCTDPPKCRLHKGSDLTNVFVITDLLQQTKERRYYAAFVELSERYLDYIDRRRAGKCPPHKRLIAMHNELRAFVATTVEMLNSLRFAKSERGVRKRTGLDAANRQWLIFLERDTEKLLMRRSSYDPEMEECFKEIERILGCINGELEVFAKAS